METRRFSEKEMRQFSQANQGGEINETGAEKSPDLESAQKYLNGFFGSEAKVEIFGVADQGGLRFKAETEISLTEKDEGEKSGNLAISIQGSLTDKEKNIWSVDQANAEYNGRQFALGELMPAGVFLTLSPDVNSFELKNKIVNINDFSTVNALCGLLHEAGHAINNTPDDIYLHHGWDKESTGEAINWYEYSHLGDKIKAVSDSERRAWVSAYLAAKKAGLPIEKPLLQLMEQCLFTYDQAIAYSRFRDFEGKDFASKKSKKLFATREKQMESRLFIELTTMLENLKSEIGIEIDLNLIEGKTISYEKDERQYSVKLSDKTGKFYSISERTFNDDGSMNSTHLITDPLLLLISKKKMAAEKAPDGTEQIKTNVLMDERIELLKEDSLDRNKIDDINHEASMLIKKLDNNYLAVAAYRLTHPQAPEPPNFDSETGRPLSVQKKIQYMKENTPAANKE